MALHDDVELLTRQMRDQRLKGDDLSERFDKLERSDPLTQCPHCEGQRTESGMRDHERLHNALDELREVNARFPREADTRDIVLQGHVHPRITQMGRGAPTHVAREGTPYWDKTNNKYYVNAGGAVGWAEIAVGSFAQTTLNLQVSSGVDDAWESQADTNFTATSVDIILGADSSPDRSTIGGFRFTNVTVPQGADIASATIQLHIITQYDTNVEIYAEDVDDAVNFVDNADVFARARTTAVTSWVADDLGAGFTTSPEIKAVIQEIVARVGWVSGNDIVVLVKGKRDITKRCYVTAYEGTPGNAAKLDITYTVSSGHTVVSHLDTTATGTELETLTDGSDADSLHNHPADLTPAEHTAIGDGTPHHVKYLDSEAITAVPYVTTVSFGWDPQSPQIFAP